MRLFYLILAFGIFGAGIAYAQVSNDFGMESKLMAMEQIEKVQAPRTKDFKALDAMLDEAFACVDPEGNLLNKAEVLAHLQTDSSIEFVPNSLAVRIQGNTAIVTGLYWKKVMQHGRPFVRRSRFVDTWLYKGGRWVAIASLSTPSEVH
ncbi:MAG TPA: nuclear transport factor 2 family protein [Candidatus Sulfotelmatobacter sp.]|jgi:hypothetical protein|nr:nuclear transport factor 2 family protein [Candidatus Sulfotelmatobacter sp.]